MFRKRSHDTTGRLRATQPVQREAVFSYANRRSVRPGAAGRDMAQPEQEASRRGPRFPWLRRVPAVASLLVFAVVVLAMLQLGSNPKVVTVDAAQGSVFLRDRRVYAEAASKAFTSFLNSNKLTVNAEAIIAELRTQFPELASVSVSLPIVGNQPIVYIQPAAPKLILVAQDGMYLLDSTGRALITANQVQHLERLKVPVVTDQSNLPVEVGQVALPRSTVAFITEVTGQLQRHNITITSLTLPLGTNELHVRFEGAGYYVKFNLQGKAGEEAGAFLAIKQHLEKRRIGVNEYVDVRVEGKAYYR